MKKKNGYYVNKHSCFLLQYHLVLVTKYRHKIIIGDLKDFLIGYTQGFFKSRSLNILAINTDKDHVHIMFEAYPNLNLSTFIGVYKSCSSKTIQNKFSQTLSKYYWKPYLWSKSYFISTVSEHSTKAVEEYIHNQGVK